MANGNYTFSGLFYYLMKPYKGHPDSFRTSRCRPRQRRPLWRFPYFHFTPNLSVLEPPLPSIWLKRVNPHGSSSIFKSSPTQCLRPQVRPPTSSPLIIVTLSLKSGPWTLCFLSQFQLSEYFKKRKKKNWKELRCPLGASCTLSGCFQAKVIFPAHSKEMQIRKKDFGFNLWCQHGAYFRLEWR